jgi:hypothetical protein
MALPAAWSRFLADVATGVWRVRRRLGAGQAAQPVPDLRRLIRDVEALWDALAQAGVQVLDHTGAVYDPAEAVQVTAFQPASGLDRERVLETLRPTIYFGGEWIQMGEVVVGTPADTHGVANPGDGAPAEGEQT